MTPEQRFEILKTELSLIQATLDKYDDLIFRSRNFFITLWLASLGLAFTIKSPIVPLLGFVLSLIYWGLEGMMRHQYWFKYVDRYRFLRNSISNQETKISDISVYDLTNHFHRSKYSRWGKIRACFFKLEPTVLYGVMGLAAVALWLILRDRLIWFPAGS